jgi:glycerate 2-kinase
MVKNRFIPSSFYSVSHFQDISLIIQAALEAVDPIKSIERGVQLNDVQIFINGIGRKKNGGSIFACGAGKASAGMATGLLNILGERITSGFVITKKLPGDFLELKKHQISIFLGDHPVPGNNSVNATKQLITFLQICSPQDLVICLISGGASALMVAPVIGISLENIRSITRILLACGATINEINSVRKHLDRVKGGGLIRMVNGARIFSLIMSDVVGDPISVIASGPTSPDPSTFFDAWQVFEKYRIVDQIPADITHVIKDGMDGKLPETLKENAPVFRRTSNHIIANNTMAVDQAVQKAREFGYESEALGAPLTGEARDVGKMLAEMVCEISKGKSIGGKGKIFISGGETTVTKSGDGLGGRNLEVALGAVRPMDGVNNAAIITFATDGEDGPTDAAGAIVTGDTYRDGLKLGIQPESFLASNDSYHYFNRLDSLIKTGSTGTNVMDLAFLYIPPIS